MVFVFFKSHFHFIQIISVKVELSFSVSIPTFLTVLTKYLLNIFAILISISTVSSFSISLIVVLVLTFFKKRGLTFCHLKQSLHQDLKKWSFLAFFMRLTQNFLCYLYSFLDVSFLSRKILFRSLEHRIIALCKSFVINFPWFALRYFIFIEACLFKISTKMLRKCWYSILLMSCFNISFFGNFCSPYSLVFSVLASENTILTLWLYACENQRVPFQTHYLGNFVFGLIPVSIFPYLVRMWENTNKNNSEYGHFLRSVNLHFRHFSNNLSICDDVYTMPLRPVAFLFCENQSCLIYP